MKKYLLLLISCCWLASACKKDTKLPAMPVFAQLMIYNGSPEYYGQNSVALLNNAAYGSRQYNENGAGLIGAFNFSRYSYIDTGLYRLAFTDSAWQSGNGSKLAETWLNFENLKHYTVYLSDSLGFYNILYTNDDVAPEANK